MIEDFLQYGQWVILVLSILSLNLVSSVKHETRLNGYIPLRRQQICWSNSIHFC